MDPTIALLRCGGAARPRRLRQLGVSRQGLRTAALRGDVLQLHGGGFALPGADPEIATAVRLNGVVSHISAARLHEFELWRPPTTLHISVPRSSPVKEDGVRVHRRPLPVEDLDPWRPITAPLRTALDCGRSLPFCDAVVLLDSGLRLGKYTLDALLEAARQARGNDTAALRRAANHVDRMSGSGLESATRLLAELLGRKIQSQVWIDGVGPVDLLVDGWLVLESDGYEFHSNRDDFRKDRRRNNALAERGYVLLRLPFEDVKYRAVHVLAQIERVMARGRPYWLAQYRTNHVATQL